jgi:hypothetical protein
MTTHTIAIIEPPHSFSASAKRPEGRRTPHVEIYRAQWAVCLLIKDEDKRLLLQLRPEEAVSIANALLTVAEPKK